MSEAQAPARFARVTEMRPPAVAILRLLAASQSVLERCRTAIGMALPSEPNRAAGEDPRLLWLAPNQWAVLSWTEPKDFCLALRAACTGSDHHVADLHDAWAGFVVQGDDAAALIARGCSLDFHRRVFPPDQCARTLIAEIPVLIDRPPGLNGFVLYVDRTLAHHLRAWLEHVNGAPVALEADR
jgi:sarcosine oxidase subunit gamma